MINHMLTQDLRGRNINHVFWPALKIIGEHHERRESRVGPTLEWYGVWCTTYTRPLERVLFDPIRDCNPFFHLMESLWMLAGRRDVEFVSEIVPRMKEFSDNGVFLNGAYGHRWRKHFCLDQIDTAIKTLNDSRDSRRVYVGMWDPYADLESRSKDIPCNVGIHFYIRDDKLTMTVFNRSNDMIWGAYGANVVHMSMLQEYVAHCVGLEVGGYTQVSSSMHVYSERKDVVKLLSASKRKGYFVDDPYDEGLVKPFNMINVSRRDWGRELLLFLEAPSSNGFSDPFFSRVAKPMYLAWLHLKNKENSDRFTEARDILDQCHASDWKRAGYEWVNRAEERTK